jgi:hypothetical protein
MKAGIIKRLKRLIVLHPIPASMLNHRVSLLLSSLLHRSAVADALSDEAAVSFMNFLLQLNVRGGVEVAVLCLSTTQIATVIHKAHGQS